MTSRAPCNYILLPVAIAVCASLSQAQPVTTIQIVQNDPSIVYTGTWYQNYQSPNIGGSANLTNAKGATATLSFTGTGITWIGVLDPYSGMAMVYLDGTPNIVDTYGKTTLYQWPLFSMHGLAPGVHTLSIQVLHQRDGETNGSWIWINAFNIENGSSLVGGVNASAGRIEQNNPAVTYNGNWYLNTNSIMSGGTAALGMDPNSSVTVTFSGTGITWIGYQDQWSGIANVSLDGKPLSPPLDTYAPSQKAQSSVFSISNLIPGTHTLLIVVTGTHDTYSAGSWIWVDAFNVI